MIIVIGQTSTTFGPSLKISGYSQTIIISHREARSISDCLHHHDHHYYPVDGADAIGITDAAMEQTKRVKWIELAEFLTEAVGLGEPERRIAFI
jgi:hypothetical protein